MSAPVILEVAANGVTTRTQNPAVPREPKELAEDALACFAAGAAIVHTHTHEPALPPADGAALYLEAYRPVLAKRPGALLYPPSHPAARSKSATAIPRCWPRPAPSAAARSTRAR